MRYCAGCGEKKPLRWPKGDTRFCKKDCAAITAMIQLEAGDGADFYCPDCGNVGCQGCN